MGTIVPERGCILLTQSHKELITKNIPLVVFLVKRYAGYRHPCYEDLIQEGIMGLIRASERFNSCLGVPFSAYASQWIMVRIYRYKKKITEEAVVSLDEIVESYGGTLGEFIQDEGLSPYEQAVEAETRDKIRACIDTLPERERKTLQYYMQGCTLKEIGEGLHLTRQRVEQIKRQALIELRKAMTPGGGGQGWR